MENTHISWADDTFNPWEGCQKTGSPACEGCYAEARNLRYAPKGSTEAPNWGPHAARRRTSASNWAKPLKWNREEGERIALCRDRGLQPIPRRFVFCASLADVFDNAVPMEWRSDLFELIHKTPHLTWLLLTKRPQNIERLWFKSAASQGWPKNAAIGCTVVTQAEAERDIPHLLRAKNALSPAFAFLSMEPLMEEVDLEWPVGLWPNGPPRCCSGFECGCMGQPTDPPLIHDIDWIITGGETDQGAHKARPTPPSAFRSIRDQCAVAGVPYHHKQNGEWVSVSEVEGPQTAFHEFPDGACVRRVGKARAGRTLDGVIHDARPDVP